METPEWWLEKRKTLRPAIALLALLSLIGGGVALKMTTDTEAKRRVADGAAMPDGGDAERGKSKGIRHEKGDAERLARVRGWLMKTGGKRMEHKEWVEMQATINGLSLDAIRELLADPEGLADVITGFIDDAWPIHTYPQRFDVRLLIWQRYGELAPDEALALAFPEGKPSKDTHIQIEDILLGITKADPMRGFRTFLSHYSDSGYFDRMNRFEVSDLAQEIAEKCTKTNPTDVAAELGELGKAMRPYAYRGYASALGEGTDWAAEVVRLEELFPDPKERHFSSQHPTAALVTSWAKSNPAAAFAWMESLGKNEDRTLTGMGYMEVVAMWMREQPAASVDFLKTWDFPVSSEDDLYAHVLSGYGSMSTEVTQGMLELIEDPAKRDAAARDLIESDHPDEDVLRRLETSKHLSDATRLAAAEALTRRAKTAPQSGR